MQRLLPALCLVLLACGSPVVSADGGSVDVGALDGGPTPVCRPASENPDCTGDCSYYEPNCPTGYAAVCSIRRAHWFVEDATCWLSGDVQYAYCDGPALAPCAGGRTWQCAPTGCPGSPSPDGYCDPANPGLPCGLTCTGWGVGGCACSSSRGCLP